MLDTTRRGGLAQNGARFLLAGLANSALTFTAYQLLLFVMPHQAAYALSWVVGLGFVVIFYPSRVFSGGRTDWVARASVAALYAVVFLVGLATIEVLTAAGLSPRIAIVIAMAGTTLTNFIGSHFLLVVRKAKLPTTGMGEHERG